MKQSSRNLPLLVCLGLLLVLILTWGMWLSHRVLIQQKETRALEALSKTWKVGPAADASRTTHTLDLVERWLTWPVRKIFGQGTVSKRRSVSLQAPPGVSMRASLQSLSALSQLESLTIYCPGNTALDRFPDEQSLLVLESLPMLRSLSLSGDFSTDHLNVVFDLTELQKLTLYFHQPFSLNGIDSLTKLERLEPQPVPADLSPLRGLQDLRALILSGVLSAETFDSLAGTPALEEIDLSSARFEQEALVAGMAKLPSLKSLRFEDDHLSVASYMALTNQGASVTHLGLTDYVLSNNVVRINEENYAVDHSRSHLFLLLDADTGTLICTMELQCDDPLASRVCPQPHVQSPEFVFDPQAGTHPSVIGSTNVIDVETGNLYCGIHIMPRQNRLQMHFPGDGLAQVQWRFLEDPKFEVRFEVLAGLPLPSLKVTSVHPLTEARAQAVIRQFFPLGTFHKPARVTAGSWSYSPVPAGGSVSQ